MAEKFGSIKITPADIAAVQAALSGDVTMQWVARHYKPKQAVMLAMVLAWSGGWDFEQLFRGALRLVMFELVAVPGTVADPGVINSHDWPDWLHRKRASRLIEISWGLGLHDRDDHRNMYLTLPPELEELARTPAAATMVYYWFEPAVTLVRLRYELRQAEAARLIVAARQLRGVLRRSKLGGPLLSMALAAAGEPKALRARYREAMRTVEVFDRTPGAGQFFEWIGKAVRFSDEIAGWAEQLAAVARDEALFRSQLKILGDILDCYVPSVRK
jgi:hypothetical protein